MNLQKVFLLKILFWFHIVQFLKIEADYIESQKIFTEHPCWNKFLVIQLQKALIMKTEREREFLLFDAEQRYSVFLQQFPKLDNRVKQHIIASYLRITPESLSRIRKKMDH